MPRLTRKACGRRSSTARADRPALSQSLGFRIPRQLARARANDSDRLKPVTERCPGGSRGSGPCRLSCAVARSKPDRSLDARDRRPNEVVRDVLRAPALAADEMVVMRPRRSRRCSDPTRDWCGRGARRRRGGRACGRSSPGAAGSRMPCTAVSTSAAERCRPSACGEDVPDQRALLRLPPGIGSRACGTARRRGGHQLRSTSAPQRSSIRRVFQRMTENAQVATKRPTTT